MLLVNPSQSFQIDTAVAVTTTELLWYLEYQWQGVAQQPVYGKTQSTVGPVTMLAGPSAYSFLITSIMIYNPDTASASVTLYFLDENTGLQIQLTQISTKAGGGGNGSDCTLFYELSHGWYLL